MNRKELGCATLGALLGAAGCSPAARSLLVPEASAAQPDFVPSGVVISYLFLWFPYPQPRASHVFLTGANTYSVSSSNTAVLQATLTQGTGGTQASVNLTSRGKGEAIVKVHDSGKLVLEIYGYVHAL